MIGVAGRDDVETFQEWVSSRDVEGFDHVMDPDGDIWREFGITSQPAFVFVNDDGTVETRRGALGLEGLTERVNDLIAA